MIRLFVFRSAVPGTPNMSQFCAKLETALRLAGVAYETVYESSPAGAPKGKLPFVEIEGKRIGDSALILEHLRATRGIDLDAGLTEMEKAQSHMLQRMVEERLNFVLGYSRWIDPVNWPLTRAGVARNLRFPFSRFVPERIRARVAATLHAQGTGRHTRDEIYALGSGDLAALATFLGDKPFFFGERPTLADATVFGFLVNIIGPDLPSPLKDAAHAHPNLVAHTERMGEIYAATRQTRLLKAA